VIVRDLLMPGCNLLRVRKWAQKLAWLNPACRDYWVIRGIVEMALGDFGPAKRLILKAMEFGKTSGNLRLLGWIYLKRILSKNFAVIQAG